MIREPCHGAQQPSTNGAQNRTHDDGGDVVPDALGDLGGNNARDYHGDDHGDRVDARVHCAQALGDLEPDGEVVCDGHDGAVV